MAYTFSATSDRINMNGAVVQTGTLLTTDEFQQRFFCDIIKDSQTETKVTNPFALLRTCFPTNINNIPPTIADYSRILASMEARLLQDQNVVDKVTHLKNILKSSTIGSNTQISDATHVLWESGFNSKDVCRRPDIIRVRTSAATLDPISKDHYDMLFNENVAFDAEFTNRLGFPGGITWQTQSLEEQQSGVTINFGNGQQIQGVVTNSPTNRGDFQPYCQGNNTKNAEINILATQSNFVRIIILFIMKELGDVAQVWMYLAFVVINAMERTSALMVTTDNVVYIFCILLHLSCMNTGSREGVQSGCCTLKYYLAGVVNYSVKFKNMIDVHRKRVLQHNNSIILGLRIMQTDLGSVDYYKVYGDGLRRVVANRGVTQATQKADIKELIDAAIGHIDSLNAKLDTAYQHYFEEAVRIVDDASVTEKYNEFIAGIQNYKYYQCLTKLTNKRYVLLPGVFLDKFIDIVGLEGLRLPESVDEIYKFLATDNIRPALSSGGSKNIKKGGGEKRGKDGYHNYYECLLLCYIYYKDFGGKKSNLDSDESQIIFALLYDNYVYKLEK